MEHKISDKGGKRMPIVDMPLEELKVYQGVNPRPQDFEEYWQRGLSEMEALGTGYELEKAPFDVPGAQMYHMYYTGVHGARIHALFARPAKREGKIPAVLQFHGYSGGFSSFYGLLGYVCAGFAVAAMDARGQGGYSEDVGGVKGNTLNGHIIRGLSDPDSDRLLFRDIFLDTAQLARIVMAMDDIDETRVGAMGGSQGGGLTLACAALTPDLNRAASQYPFLSDYRRVWDMDLDKQAYAELRAHFRSFDPRHLREDEIFRKLGYIDVHHLADRIRARVLMLTGLLDDVCPPSTQFAAYNHIQSPKEMILYPDFGHEYIPDCDDAILQYMLEMKK